MRHVDSVADQRLWFWWGSCRGNPFAYITVQESSGGQSPADPSSTLAISRSGTNNYNHNFMAETKTFFLSHLVAYIVRTSHPRDCLTFLQTIHTPLLLRLCLCFDYPSSRALARRKRQQVHAVGTATETASISIH